MTGSRARPALASDDWMLEQQVRAELEAEAWRRLRTDLAIMAVAEAAAEASAPATEPQFDHHRAGSTVLKAIVRFMLAAFGAYLGWIAAMDSGLGEFEVWLAVGSTFLVTLALTMFGPARELVHTLAETARWVLIVTLALGGAWILFQMSA